MSTEKSPRQILPSSSLSKEKTQRVDIAAMENHHLNG